MRIIGSRQRIKPTDCVFMYSMDYSQCWFGKPIHEYDNNGYILYKGVVLNPFDEDNNPEVVYHDYYFTLPEENIFNSNECDYWCNGFYISEDMFNKIIDKITSRDLFIKIFNYIEEI